MTLDEALQEYEAGRAWLAVPPAEREAAAADMDLGGVPGDARRAERIQKAGRPEFDALVRQRRDLFQKTGIPTELVPAELDPITKQPVAPERVRPLEKLPRSYEPSIVQEWLLPAAKALWLAPGIPESPQGNDKQIHHLNQELMDVARELLPLVKAEKQGALPADKIDRLKALRSQRTTLQADLEKLDQEYAILYRGK